MDKKISRLRRAIPTRKKSPNCELIAFRFFARISTFTQTLFRPKVIAFWFRPQPLSLKCANNLQLKRAWAAMPLQHL